MESFEQTKHREGHEPPLPHDLLRGTPGSVLAPVEELPLEDIPDPTPDPTLEAEEGELEDQLLAQTGKLAPSQSLLPGLADWNPIR